MSSLQLEFFNKLNAELSKIESFFIEREAEARVRSLQLRGQLEELKDHRRLFHVTWSFISFNLHTTDKKKFLIKDAHPDFQAALSFLSSSGSKTPTLMSYVPRFWHRSTHTDNKVHNTDVARESHRLSGGAKLDPDEYLHARKQLKRAVLEHYHALEILNNYRVRPALSCWPPWMISRK